MHTGRNILPLLSFSLAREISDDFTSQQCIDNCNKQTTNYKLLICLFCVVAHVCIAFVCFVCHSACITLVVNTVFFFTMFTCIRASAATIMLSFLLSPKKKMIYECFAFRGIKFSIAREKAGTRIAKRLTSCGFIMGVTSGRTIAHLFNLLLCLRGKWKDKRCRIYTSATTFQWWPRGHVRSRYSDTMSRQIDVFRSNKREERSFFSCRTFFSLTRIVSRLTIKIFFMHAREHIRSLR